MKLILNFETSVNPDLKRLTNAIMRALDPQLETLINKADLGSGIVRYFHFMVIKPEDYYLAGEPKKSRDFLPRKKELWVSESFDFDEFCKLSPNEAIRLALESLKRASKEFPTISKLKNFDIERYQELLDKIEV